VGNVTVHLLDEHLEPVPVGVRGELYAGGACVPRGYWNDPLLTAQKVVPDPFGATGARLYRTGDLARHLAGGEIEYLGRIDGQVKVRGFRVELGEVETTLARHPGVRDAAVVAVAGKEGPRLAAYVVPEAGWPFSAEELRQHLKQQLPEYMVPASWVPMTALPVNANGKLDQAALPEPAPVALETRYVVPRSALEQVVADIWREVLGVERVGAEDDFFACGGHSLLATQVMSRIAAIFQVQLPLRRMFEAPTVAALAASITAAEPQPGRSEKLAGALLRIKSMGEGEKREALAGGRAGAAHA
jgi:acyl carrier protein